MSVDDFAFVASFIIFVVATMVNVIHNRIWYRIFLDNFSELTLPGLWEWIVVGLPVVIAAIFWVVLRWVVSAFGPPR